MQNQVLSVSVSQLAAEKGTICEPAPIIRGTYLQKGTASSIIIRWATDVPVLGKVWYQP